MASVSEMIRSNQRQIAPSSKRGCLLTPSDLEERFREWQRLRKLVNDLEEQQNIGDACSNTNEERKE